MTDHIHLEALNLPAQTEAFKQVRALVRGSFKSPDGLLKLNRIHLKNRNAMRFLEAMFQK